MPLEPTGIVNFNWNSISGVEGYIFKVNKNNLFFQNYVVPNLYPSNTSFEISGFIEGDSIGGTAYPFTGDNVYRTGVSIANQIIPITNFHNSGLLFEFDKININSESINFSDTNSGYYLTGNYEDGIINIDFSLINPRDSEIINEFGVEPFLESIQFKKIYSGNELFSTENLNSFNYTFENNGFTRNANLQIVVNDAYGSGITGDIYLKNEPISVKSFSETSSNLLTGIRTNILPIFSQTATGLDYVIYSGLSRNEYYNSGSAASIDTLSFDFPLNKTGFLELIPYDWFGSGHKYFSTDPIFFDPKDFLDFNKIKNLNVKKDLLYDQHFSLFANYQQKTTSGSYFKFSIDSNSVNSFESNSYHTGLVDNLLTGFHFDYFSNRTGTHEDFYCNVELYQSGTNLLEDSKQFPIKINQPSLVSSGFSFDYIDGVTTISFETDPPYDFSGIDVLVSGEGDVGYSTFSGNTYTSGDLNTKLGIKLQRISDSYLYTEKVIVGSGIEPSVRLNVDNYSRSDGNLTIHLQNEYEEVPITYIEIFRKPSFVELFTGDNNALTPEISGVLDFNDYANHILETGVLGFQADAEPLNIPLSNQVYQVTGIGYTGSYESGRHFIYGALAYNGYGAASNLSNLVTSEFPITSTISQNIANNQSNTNTITSFFDQETGVVFITGEQTIVGLKHIDNNFHINHTGYIGEDLEVTGDATIGTGQTLFEINNQGIYGYNTGYFEKDLNVTGDLTVGTGSSIFEIKEDAVLVNKTGYFKEDLTVSGDLNVLGNCNGCGGGGGGSTQFLFFGHNAVFTNNFTTYATVDGSKGGGWLMPVSGKINSFTHQGTILATGNSEFHSANLWLRIYVNDVSQRQVNVHDLSHIGSTGSKVNLGPPVYFSGLDRIKVLARTSAADVEFEDASAILETTVYST